MAKSGFQHNNYIIFQSNNFINFILRTEGSHQRQKDLNFQVLDPLYSIWYI